MDAAPFEAPRYRNVLVAVDGSPASMFALRHAVRLGLDDRARLTLVSVIPETSPSVALAGMSPREVTGEMEQEAERGLRELRETLPREVSLTTVVRRGDPAAEILAMLEEGAFDLVLTADQRGAGALS